MKKRKQKKQICWEKNVSVINCVESVLRLEGSLWWERFVKEVGLEPGVKERGSYGWWEWWVDRVRRGGRSMNGEKTERLTMLIYDELCYIYYYFQLLFSIRFSDFSHYTVCYMGIILLKTTFWISQGTVATAYRWDGISISCWCNFFEGFQIPIIIKIGLIFDRLIQKIKMWQFLRRSVEILVVLYSAEMHSIQWYVLLLCNQPSRPTQPPTLRSMGNEYSQKCGGALWLGNEDRYGLFHLWIKHEARCIGRSRVFQEIHWLRTKPIMRPFAISYV